MSSLLGPLAAAAIAMAPVGGTLAASPQASASVTDPVADALALEARGDAAGAIALLDSQASGSPSDRSEIRLAAARILARQKRWEDALAEGYAGIAADQQDGFTYLEVAKILDRAGRHAAAIELAQEAASRDVRVRFAAKDLIFDIQTRSGAPAEPPPAAPSGPKVPSFLWALWGGLLTLLVGGLAAWSLRRRRPSRSAGVLPTVPEPAPPSALATETRPDTAELMVPQAEPVGPTFAYGRQLAAGDTLGPYKIVRVVATSLHSTLYCAEDLRLKRLVALKQANAMGMQSEAALNRFQKEVQSLIALSNYHDGVIKVYDYLPPATLVTEWVDGENLDAVVGEMPVDRVLQIAVELCDILAFAHSMSIIHRDIKPSNVMVSQVGRVKLLDFGIAKNAALGTSQLTMDSDVPIGTFTYMAPEQFASPSQARAESDVYSLGLSLYRLLTGALPATPWLGPRTFGLVPPDAFIPVDEFAPAIQAFLQDVGVFPDLDWVDDLDRAVRKAFNEDPGDRYHSAQEFKKELERILAMVKASIRV